MGNAIFITGTDTGVGKTFVTIKLAKEFMAKGFSVGIMKPISCGPMRENDAFIYRAKLKLNDPLKLINPIVLKSPLAPYAASKLEGKKIDLKKIFAAFKTLKASHDILLVEGVGGALVPIKKNYFVADLIRDLKIPVIIVARAGLGTINHTLLTIEAVRKRKIKILEVILNGFRGELSENTNPKIIRELGRVGKIRMLPWEN